MYNSYCTFRLLSFAGILTTSIIWIVRRKICHTLKVIQDFSRQRMTKRPYGIPPYGLFISYHSYLLKKSGILMDCSFTFGDGVFGVSSVGAGCGAADLLGTAVVAPPLDGAIPRSSFGGCC